MPTEPTPDAPALYDMSQRRPRDSERTTRRPLGWWDRVKFLLLAGFVFGALLLQAIGDNPIRSVADSFWDTVDRYWWLAILAAAEVVRQVHFLIAERWARYYRIWTTGVFAKVTAATERIDPWTRFRLSRALKWAVGISIFAIIVGNIMDEQPITALFLLPSRLWEAAPTILRFVALLFIIVGQFAMIFWFLSRGGIEVYYPDDIDTRFDDVWGQDGVVEKVKENLLFLEDPEAIESRGGYAPGGILLWGPPGTGKTLMAEAAAGETGKPFVFVDPGAFIQMFMGVGILKVKRLFRKLRKLALRYGGVVVFFDEADALGNRGSAIAGQPQGIQPQGLPSFWEDADAPGSALPYLSEGAQVALRRWALADGPDVDPPSRRRQGVIMGMGGGGMGTLQALLTELSGLKKPRGLWNRTIRKALGMRPKPPPRYRILVMMASNMPEALDAALLRPGRLDRIYKVGYPTKEGRKRTYEGYFAKLPHTLEDPDFEKLAVITPYATGAVIKDMANEALINAIRDGREVITWADVIKAKQLKEHGLADDFEYVERERHAIAIHEACHAVAAYRLRDHLVIDTATIERRGGIGGFVASIPPEDRFTHWRSEYETDLQVGLASLAGERMFFGGDNSSGVGGDLRGATKLSLDMVGYWGMGETVASHAVQRQFGVPGGRGRGPGDEDDEERELLRGNLGEQIEEKLQDMLARAATLLEENRLEVLAVAHALEVHRTITGEDVEAIIDGRQGAFIDGRTYHTPEAREALEAYHRAAAAHRSQDGPPTPLPAIGGVGYRAGSIPASTAAMQAQDASVDDG